MSSEPAPSKRVSAAHVAVENTVRLRGDELDRIHADLDALSPQGASVRRRYVRWPFRRACIRVDVIISGRTASTLKYACRNLSGSGVSILHSAYMHPGTECVVYLPSLAGTLERLAGQVRRCRHFRGHIHEVGIAFTSAIEVGKFVDLDPYNGRFAFERADPKRLGGTILHVEPSEEDRRLLREIVKETEFEVVCVTSAAEALPRAAEGFDAIFIDAELGDGKGPELARQLREGGCKSPIVITSADASAELRESARLTKAGAFLVKPLTEPAVLRALADLVPARVAVNSDNAPIHCSLRPDDPARKELPKAIAELQSVARDLQTTLESGDIPGLRRHCARAKTVAPPAGFAPVAALAAEGIRVLKGGNLGEAAAALRSLIDACRRVTIDAPPGGAGEQKSAASSNHAPAHAKAA